MTLTDRELAIVTDEVYDSINDAHTHDLMHIVYIYLDYFNEYGSNYEWLITSTVRKVGIMKPVMNTILVVKLGQC